MATKEKRRPASRSQKAPAAKPRRPERTSRVPERRRRKEEDPRIVYTQPPAFNRAGFLTRLATVAAVVLALTLGMSIFFKVENVAVSGNEKYSAWDVRQASGIQDGENLLTLNKAKIVGKLQAKLPYADDIRVGIKLPDTVNIEIVELDVAYAIREKDSGWWLMTAGGKVLDPITEAQAQGYTQILGVEITTPQIGMQAVAAEETPEETEPDPEASTEPTSAPQITVLGSERLRLAIDILHCLESSGIMGAVNTVDVTSISQLVLRYDDRYDVLLGDSSLMDKKIRYMKEAVLQMTDYQTGTLDVSFTTWDDTVIFTPLSEEIA